MLNNVNFAGKLAFNGWTSVNAGEMGKVNTPVIADIKIKDKEGVPQERLLAARPFEVNGKIHVIYHLREGSFKEKDLKKVAFKPEEEVEVYALNGKDGSRLVTYGEFNGIDTGGLRANWLNDSRRDPNLD